MAVMCSHGLLHVFRFSFLYVNVLLLPIFIDTLHVLIAICQSALYWHIGLRTLSLHYFCMHLVTKEWTTSFEILGRHLFSFSRSRSMNSSCILAKTCSRVNIFPVFALQTGAHEMHVFCWHKKSCYLQTTFCNGRFKSFWVP